MNERETLRASGAAIREKLGISGDARDALAPGLGNLVDEACFGRLWARPGLALNERMLATLSALTSRQYLPQLSTYVEAALHIGMSAQSVQEVVIHCSLYSGFPSAENSLAVIAEVLERTGTPLPATALPACDLSDFERMGEETKHALHAERAEAGYASPGASAAAELYITAIQYGYGDIWNRPGLSRRERMVCSVAAFTAIEAASQSRKFFRSALNVGFSREQVIEIIMQTGPYSGFPRALNALMIADEVLA